MLAFQPAGVVYAASRNNRDVRAVFNVEIVVDEIVKPCFGQYDGDIHSLALGCGLDEDVDARLVGFGANIDIGGDVSTRKFAVVADVVCTLRNTFQIRYLFEQVFFDFSETHFATTCALSVSA